MYIFYSPITLKITPSQNPGYAPDYYYELCIYIMDRVQTYGQYGRVKVLQCQLSQYEYLSKSHKH